MMRATMLLPVVLALGAGVARGQTTAHQIPYQGRLDLDGVAMNGAFDFQFEIYTSDTLGDCGSPAVISGYCVWADELAAVDVVGGNFSVVLGSATNPLGDVIWQNVEVFLGIRVAAAGDAYTPLAGRQRILAVPLAARAETALNYHVTGTLQVGGRAGIGGAPAANRDLQITGRENDGNAATVAIVSGSTMLIDADEIDALGGDLNLQRNSTHGVRVHGPMTFSGAPANSVPNTSTGLWGSWYPSATTWYECPADHYVCGWRIRWEPDQGSGDDTAMNWIQMKCCSLGS